MNLFFSDLEPSIRSYLQKASTATKEPLYTRSAGRGPVLRLNLLNGGSVILKVWFARNLKERFKSLVCLSNGRREWRMHRMIHRVGLSTPEPLGFYRLTIPGGEQCEVLAIEDLGSTRVGLLHLKQLISDGLESSVLAFENCLIEETSSFVRKGIVDIDHTLNNFVVDNKARLMRIDFECALRYPFHLIPRKAYVKMLARFLTGHIYAVQPDVYRSVCFAERLYKKLNIQNREKLSISILVNENLLRQEAKSGFKTSVSLPL